MDIPKVSQIAMLIEAGNYAQVELYGRIILKQLPSDPYAHLAIAWATYKVGLDDYAKHHYIQVVNGGMNPMTIASDLSIQAMDLTDLVNAGSHDAQRPGASDDSGSISAEHFLLIKAWGYGFWSDVLHVLGGLMLAEITQRKSVVYWGANSLYSVDKDKNAFETFFAPCGGILQELKSPDFDYFPPKWNNSNLMSENINRSKGPWSKVSGLDILPRDERVCVMDYYIGVLNLMPYIPPGSKMSGMDIDEVYRYLISKYLLINPEITVRADKFYRENFSDREFLAIHVRGSDKVGEFKEVDKFHARYQTLIKSQLDKLSHDSRIFLMTDDTRLLDNYRKLYGERVITTDCLRTSTGKGVHYQAGDQITLAAEEVIIDTLVASKANYFVGNGFSNPSIFVYYLSQTEPENISLIGGNRMHHYNTHLYKTIPVV